MAKNKLESVFRELSKDELVDILLNICGKNKDIKDSLVFEFVDSKCLTKKKVTEIINKITKRHTDRYNFIDYRSADFFLEDMLGVLESIRDEADAKINLDNTLTFLTKSLKSFEILDDSNGVVRELMESAFSNIVEIIDSIRDENIRKEVFNKLLKYTDNNVLDDLKECRYELFNIMVSVIKDDITRKKLEDRVYRAIEEAKQDFYSEYDNEACYNILLMIKIKLDTEKEADKFLMENIRFNSFRRMLINKCINCKDYDKAIEVIEAGEELHKNHRIYLAEWKSLKYEVYKMLGRKQEQYDLALELYKKLDFRYYRELKELTDDKKALYNELKEYEKSRSSNNGFTNPMYLNLVLEEDDVEELMEIVKSDVRLIEDFADKLYINYKDEVVACYAHLIKIEADNATNRKQYKKVCKLIKAFGKYCALEKKLEIIKELEMKYQKKPAFIDELNNIR